MMPYREAPTDALNNDVAAELAVAEQLEEKTS